MFTRLHDMIFLSVVVPRQYERWYEDQRDHSCRPINVFECEVKSKKEYESQVWKSVQLINVDCSRYEKEKENKFLNMS